eukprot:m.101185 g.101185  ORF g.101185 m.101185 type:complete len:281 (+) comp37117_c0_seq1:732-1574(+)
MRPQVHIQTITLPVPLTHSTILKDEGELFTVFLDLFADWKNDSERDKIWITKRPKLTSVDYHTPEGPISVQLGWHYSAHEMWKFLELPYTDIPSARKVLENGERVRTWNSALKRIPGLYAAVHDVSKTNNVHGYLICGISEVARVKSTRKDVITPYGSFPTILANESVGLAWYHTMLMGKKMQGPYGSTEGANINGTEISPLVSWDTKQITVLAMLGGASASIGKHMKANSPGKYQRFYEVIQREYALKFSHLKGEGLGYRLPQSAIPTQSLKDFTDCTL